MRLNCACLTLFNQYYNSRSFEKQTVTVLCETPTCIDFGKLNSKIEENYCSVSAYVLRLSLKRNNVFEAKVFYDMIDP